MLQSIRDNRSTGEQFYVSKVSGVGNPSFDHEPAYERIKLPDAGFQLLALFRFWNIVEYWAPYRDLIGREWDNDLTQFVPRVGLAKNAEAYQQEMMALIARVGDGHSNLWSSMDVRPPMGKCQLPVNMRFVEGRPIVSGIPGENADRAATLRVGDIVTELDGVPVEGLVEKWKPYYGASNSAAQLRDIAFFMTRGECDESSVGVVSDRQQVTLKLKREPAKNRYGLSTHDRSGATFQLLSKEVAYLKLSSVKAADVPKYMQQAADTKGLIIDIRNYPAEFMVFALGSLLVDRPTEFARFTECDLSNPGAFRWMKPVLLSPQQPGYPGKVVILVDEVSQSQAEYTAMALRAGRHAVVIGSTTAGADGNASPFALPGGLRTMISGVGIFYPDKSPTQRIGIVPNIEVKPTIAGIREGRDEVLERAVREIVGPEITENQIKGMTVLPSAQAPTAF